MRTINQTKINGAMTMRSVIPVLALASTLLSLSACTYGVGDIDRTGADKVKKSIFQGEWYFRPTVTEVQFNNGMVFEGYEGDTERIRWEIREKNLVAYRSYELLINAEDGNGDVDFSGSPVAVFAIESHFDVFRAYNPATGLQSNELVEDIESRPWYERDYMRVDWTVNLLNNPYSLESFVAAYSAAPYYPQEHEIANPDRLEITPTNINIVGNYTLTPDIYTCWDLFKDPYMCGEAAAKMKLSFMRVPAVRTTADGLNGLPDYEPLYYPDIVPITYDEIVDANTGETIVEDGTPVTFCYTDGSCERRSVPVFERFGYFRHERLAYDDEHQWTRDGRLFLGHRHNIWHRNYDADGELIDVRYREPGKVTYYKNAGYPDDPDAREATRLIAEEWDRAFRETVLTLKQETHPNLTLADIPMIFEIRTNDCNIESVNNYVQQHALSDELAEQGITDVARGNLTRACATIEYHSKDFDDPFTWQKYGDIRHSFVNWVDTPQAAGPLGYGPSSPDGLTGEIIAGTANLYGAALDTYAAYAADVVQLMNGKMDLDTVISGSAIRDHIAQTRMRNNREIDDFRMEDFHNSMFDKREGFFNGRVPYVDISNALEKGPPALRPAPLADEGLNPPQAGDNLLRRLEGHPLEKELLLDDEMKRAFFGSFDYHPGQAVDGELTGFSPVRQMLDDADRAEKARAALAAKNIMMMDVADWNDTGMASLAKDLESFTWQEVYDFMRREMVHAVLTHEVGHTLGLRHNFSSSFDAMNYNPHFWESWDPQTGKIERSDPDTGAPTTADRYMYASIMDYDARFYADSYEGIGAYDYAAIKFGYGGLVEVFNSDNVLLNYDFFTYYHDYNSIPKVVGGGDTLPCTDAGRCTESEAGQDYMTYYNAAILLDDLEVEIDNALEENDYERWAQLVTDYGAAAEESNRYFMTYLRDALNDVTVSERCSEANNWCGIWDRHYMTFEELQKRWSNCYMNWHYGVNVSCDLPSVVEYSFCSDEFSGYSWPTCKPYDKGATYREVTQDRMERYDAYYFFTNFKRDRASFDDANYLNSYINRQYSRFLKPMSDVFRYVLYSEMDMGRDKFGEPVSLADFPLGRDWQEAGVEGLNFLTQILKQPAPGEYCLQEDIDYELMGVGAACGTQEVVYCQDAVDGEFRPSATLSCGPGVEERRYCVNTAQVYRPMADTSACLDTNGDDQPDSTMEVPVGVGKYFNTNWTDEYYYKATRIGTFWDKYLALWAITDNEGSFFRDYSSWFDAGAWSLSYWSGGLKDEMLDLFRGYFDRSPGKYAWRFDASETGLDQFKTAPVVDIYVDETDYSLPRIEAPSSFTLDWYGVVLPIARFNSSFDYTADFLNYSRICLDGYIDCMTFADLQGGVTGYTAYVDPLTSYEYVAAITDRPEDAIAPHVLQDAEEFKLRVYQPKKDELAERRQYLEDYEAYLDSTYPGWRDNISLVPADQKDERESRFVDAANAQVAYEAVEAELIERNSLLDITREWSALLGGAWR